MAGIEDGEVVLEEAISWLPSHIVLDHEALWDSKDYVRHQPHHHHQYRSLPRLTLDQHPQRAKPIPGPNSRTKYATNWASGGPGMQAVFLDSGKKSSGTGVFLPQGAGTNMQSRKKPACARVLLQALLHRYIVVKVKHDQRRHKKSCSFSMMKRLILQLGSWMRGP